MGFTDGAFLRLRRRFAQRSQNGVRWHAAANWHVIWKSSLWSSVVFLFGNRYSDIASVADLFSCPCMEIQNHNIQTCHSVSSCDYISEFLKWTHLSPTATDISMCNRRNVLLPQPWVTIGGRVIRSRQGISRDSMRSVQTDVTGCYLVLIRHRCSMLQPSSLETHLSPLKVVMAGDEEVAKRRVSSRMSLCMGPALIPAKPQAQRSCTVQRIWRLRREWALARPFRWWIYIDLRSTW